MACNEICLMNQIRHTDWFFTKAEVGYGNTARFFRVIRKISLSIQIGIITNNLNSRFISADGTIRTESPEFAGMQSFLSQIQITRAFQRKIRNIIDDADDKVIFRSFFCKIIEYSYDISRQIFFSAQAKASGIYLRSIGGRCKAGSYAKVYRIAISSRFFRTIKNGYPFYCFR